MTMDTTGSIPATFPRTMSGIARELGVSIKTVSRVVNNEPGVSEPMRARVARFIETVGYHPHTGARSLRNEQQDCVGVTVTAPAEEVPIGRQFFTNLFRELFRIFGAKGNYICFDLNPYEGKGKGDFGRGLLEHRFGACVLCGPLRPSESLYRIHASGRPYLTLGRLDALPDCSGATVDYEEAAYQSVLYLAQRGHKHIGMLRGFHAFQPGEERRRGYMRAHQEAGLEPVEDLIQDVGFGPRNLVHGLHRLLTNRKVTAIVDASGAEDGQSLRDGFRRAGRAIDSDAELVCWTYSDHAVVLPEACAHMWLPVWESMADGLEQLARWFDGTGEGPIQVVFPPTLFETVDPDEQHTPVPLFQPLIGSRNR
ncbi:MAG: LacI family transcriptional regulator [Candidatus Hydrogenedentes bacterium]|nr:LacI family transcriptional regulator [Candidatus Hydrogenedentota bacterium]